MYFLFLLLTLLTRGQGQHDPNCDGKQVIVHLFEWRFDDIAAECENFLSSAGFCGVQTSPPHENVVVTAAEAEYDRPWWERYQPVSYMIASRSGDEAAFTDMVSRCNAVGVRIYVDAVLNHMAGLGRSGTGTGGSSFDSDNYDFPGVPYTGENFTPRDMCPSGDGNVNDYSDPENVRNCNLSGLTDLYGAQEYVQEKQAEYLNKLVGIGVAGFRVDAAKHMWPDDLAAIQSRLRTLPTEHGFKEGAMPFFYHEVIDRNDGAVTVDEYYHLGKVTEFRYCQKIAWATADWSQLGGIYDPGWGMADPEYAFVFVDNHDNQRGHGGSGDVVTHKTPKDYKFAVSYMLAFEYGFTRIMSSFEFGDDTDQGPPHEDDWSTSHVIVNPDGASCSGGWICEHRWRPNSGMVQFRNAVQGTSRDNFVATGDTVHFNRGNKGFFAMKKYGGLDSTISTGLPAGDYCNVIDDCATTVTVGGDGMAHIVIPDSEEPILAICVGCDGSPPPTGDPGLTTDDPGTTSDPGVTTEDPVVTTDDPSGTTGPPPGGVERTVVFIQQQTEDGQDMFIRGGIGHDQRPDCTEDAETSPCAISMTTLSLGSGSHYEKYDAWREGDTKLDWYGAQAAQGTYNSEPAEGSPLAWTSSDPGSPGYQEINTFGDHYWMIDFDMDCSETESGWFEVKAYVTNGPGWEADVTQSTCTGTDGGSAPYTSPNHMGKCGCVNVFTFGISDCEINTL